MDTILIPQLQPYVPVQTFNDSENGHWSETIVFMAVNVAFPAQNISIDGVGTSCKVNRTITCLKALNILSAENPLPKKWRFLHERRDALKAVPAKARRKYIFKKDLWKKAKNLVQFHVSGNRTKEIDICAALLNIQARLHIKGDLMATLKSNNGPLLVKVMLAWYEGLAKYSCRKCRQM